MNAGDAHRRTRHNNINSLMVVFLNGPLTGTV
jgi:hypothetical protein